ncbi:hypothetical protein [Fischerella sp. PCC 9605]|uniref:hypothetical protein n=1 Tax=Fischerella sp. PCC 9605 TaxID=1173024 RepID=UPI00047DED31|nr:hypothetical protein [Fischerella sp. PCC 9605]
MAQQYFSDSEWAILMQAPLQAVMGLTLADKTDPVSFLKEAQAGIKILAAEQQRQDITNDLVGALVASLNEADTKEPVQGEALLLKKEFKLLRELQNLKNAAEGRQKAIAHFEQVSSILAAKVTAAQAVEFKSWLMSIAQKVAEAVKEGGFLSIGGEKVSEPEASMLKKLEQTLTFKV